jgi:hypothetical protein
MSLLSALFAVCLCLLGWWFIDYLFFPSKQPANINTLNRRVIPKEQKML